MKKSAQWGKFSFICVCRLHLSRYDRDGRKAWSLVPGSSIQKTFRAAFHCDLTQMCFSREMNGWMGRAMGR